MDDEEHVLDSLVPGFVSDLARRLLANEALQRANKAAGSPLPAKGRLNIKISASGFESRSSRSTRIIGRSMSICI